MPEGSEARVAVVIPAYQAERTICRAVDSVLAQPGCTPSVIVVVDGSPDDTEGVVRQRYGGAVRVIANPENRGVQFSRDAGLAAAGDKWVMFLDADDLVEGPLLQGLVDTMAAAGADLGFGPMQVMDERSGRRGRVIAIEGSEEEIFAGWLGRGEFVGCCSVLWRTEFLRRIGGWDEALNRQEDGETVLRALLLGARIARSRAGRGVYVMHASPDRLTRRSDNLASLLDVPAKLLALPSTRFAQGVRRQACAMSYYNAARTCFLRGQPALGRRALARSRELGFSGHRGDPVRSLLATLFGLAASCRMEAALRTVAGKAV